MSAYVVDENHIAYLVQAASCGSIVGQHGHLTWIWNIDREADTYDRETLNRSDHKAEHRVGQLLWDENVTSVSARYPGDRSLPGPCDSDYQYPENPPRHTEFDPVQILQACDCYEYQSCEHDSWPGSEAKAFIDALRKTAWSSLPGYKDGIWGAPEPVVISKQRAYKLHEYGPEGGAR